MAYTAEISRANPTCFLFLIDQSSSMAEALDPTNPQPLDQPVVLEGKTYTHGTQGRSKAMGVADAINRMLQNLCKRCARKEGIRDFFYLGVIGYGETVESAFSGPLSGRDLIPISEVADNPAHIAERSQKVEDETGGLVDKKIRFPTWFEPKAKGGTPMCQALSTAHRILSDWLPAHPSCFPPIVINITDGESTDGDPGNAAHDLTGLASDDGNVLIFNAHISAAGTRSIEFPDSDSELPDDFARLLFRISSVLPPSLRDTARQDGYRVSDNTRGFVFNADLVAVIKFLDIGTRPSNLR